ncbi:MbtH family NRPS accessory protein [Bradyrhizobium ontarionense]|uniref:MbtH family NRPS accessory protein n=1 Tax=Bradyrhizobium ontarionense TaxID=2898149 RepID=A0ABY3R9Q2_9BRAD|nr:MbtH family NRPS accessory protein [Bradyrhizobium sp. A19]UFZ04105.1 MbtH family NRPS accessory protein [Bradyrhizobium sp. A19]
MSRDDEEEDDARFKVVINREEQYSIWPAGCGSPAGWRDVDVAGAKAECLAYNEQHRTDLRPPSLRGLANGDA